MPNSIDFLGNDGIFALRLIIAVLLGSLIGMERQTRGRPAGLRTNILVCLGSAAIIVAFQKFTLELGLGADSIIRMDPARAAAGVITGIGFLGAGTIIKSNDFVRGLTTAASIWVVSSIGVTVGMGEYTIAVATTLLVLISLYALHHLPIRSDHYYFLNLKWRGNLDLLEEVIQLLQKENIHIKSRQINRQPNTEKCQAMLGLRIRTKGFYAKILNQLQDDRRFDEVNWK